MNVKWRVGVAVIASLVGWACGGPIEVEENFDSLEQAVTTVPEFIRVAKHEDGTTLVVWREGARIKARPIRSGGLPSPTLDVSLVDMPHEVTDLPPGQLYNEVAVAPARLENGKAVFHVLWSAIARDGKRYVYRRVVGTDGSMVSYPFLLTQGTTDLYRGAFQPEIACLEPEGLGFASRCFAAVRVRASTDTEAYQFLVYKFSGTTDGEIVVNIISDDPDEQTSPAVYHYHRIAVADENSAMLVYSVELEGASSATLYSRSFNPTTGSLHAKTALLSNVPTNLRFDLTDSTVGSPESRFFVAYESTPTGRVFGNYLTVTGAKASPFPTILSSGPGGLVSVAKNAEGRGDLGVVAVWREGSAVMRRVTGTGTNEDVTEIGTFGGYSEIDSAKGVIAWPCTKAMLEFGICAQIDGGSTLFVR